MKRLFYRMFVLLCLAACGIGGCSKKHEEARGGSDGNSLEHKTIAPQTATDSKSPVAVKKPVPQEVITLPVEKKDANQPASKGLNRIRQGKVNNDTPEKQALAAVAEDNNVPEEPSEPNHADIIAGTDKAMDSNVPEKRIEAMSILADMQLSDPNVLGVASKGLNDEDEEVRMESVNILSFVKTPQADKLLIKALDDKSEDIRRAVLDASQGHGQNPRFSVFNAAIRSPYHEVKEETLAILTGLPERGSIDVLINGLKDSNPEFRESISSALNLFIEQEFNSYEQARKWWAANRNNYNDDLSKKNE